jgi:hypothetical protein
MQKATQVEPTKNKFNSSKIISLLSKPESIRQDAFKGTAKHSSGLYQSIEWNLRSPGGNVKFLQRKGANLHQENFDRDIASWLCLPINSLWIELLKNYQMIADEDPDYDFQLALLDFIKDSIINEQSIGREKFLLLLYSEFEFVKNQKRYLEKKKQEQLMQRMAEMKLVEAEKELKIKDEMMKKARRQDIKIEKLRKELKMNEIDKHNWNYGYQGYYFGHFGDKLYNKMAGDSMDLEIIENYFEPIRIGQPRKLKVGRIKIMEKQIKDLSQWEIEKILRPEEDAPQPEPSRDKVHDLLCEISPMYEYFSSDSKRKNHEDDQYLKSQMILQEFEKSSKLLDPSSKVAPYDCHGPAMVAMPPVPQNNLRNFIDSAASKDSEILRYIRGTPVINKFIDADNLYGLIAFLGGRPGEEQKFGDGANRLLRLLK